MGKRTASAAPIAYRGRITGDDIDISCSHQHGTIDNARICAKLALKYLRYRESLGEDGTLDTWTGTLDFPHQHDFEPQALIRELEGRET